MKIPDLLYYTLAADLVLVSVALLGLLYVARVSHWCHLSYRLARKASAELEKSIEALEEADPRGEVEALRSKVRALEGRSQAVERALVARGLEAIQ